MSYNKIIILGNLTQDPEAGTLPNSETPTSRFGVATNQKIGGKEVATFFRVSLIGNQAKVANQYLEKGRPVYIEGSLRLETFEKKDGSPGASLEVRGTEMQFVPGGGGNSEKPAVNNNDSGSDDDPPF